MFGVYDYCTPQADTLDFDEFCRIFDADAAGLGFDTEMMRVLYDAADINGDGKVDFEEFRTVIYNLEAFSLFAQNVGAAEAESESVEETVEPWLPKYQSYVPPPATAAHFV